MKRCVYCGHRCGNGVTCRYCADLKKEDPHYLAITAPTMRDDLKAKGKVK